MSQVKQSRRFKNKGQSAKERSFKKWTRITILHEPRGFIPRRMKNGKLLHRVSTTLKKETPDLLTRGSCLTLHAELFLHDTTHVCALSVGNSDVINTAFIRLDIHFEQRSVHDIRCNHLSECIRDFNRYRI